jgi:putative salt-induced outer membrane protein YdiY
MYRFLALAGCVFLFPPAMTLSQEVQADYPGFHFSENGTAPISAGAISPDTRSDAGPFEGGGTPYPAGPQLQPAVSQFPSPPSNPYPANQPPYQSAPPPNSQFVAPPASQLPPPGQFQAVPPVYPGPMPVPADSTLPPPSNTVVAPTTEPPPKLWEGSLELGLDGSEGNSQTFNLHSGAKLKRKTEFNVVSSELDYRKTTANSVDTVNKAFLDSRFEHLFQQSPWTWFVHNIDDYDEFKAYDLRVSLDTGLGYRLVRSDLMSLIGRFGGGTTREIGGPDDRFIPEAVFGLEGELKISKRQKLCASAEYRPDVTDFTDYRLYLKTAWEVMLDEEKHLSMRVSVLDRYDSNADGLKPNDLDYALTLLWSF